MRKALPLILCFLLVITLWQPVLASMDDFSVDGQVSGTNDEPVSGTDEGQVPGNDDGQIPGTDGSQAPGIDEGLVPGTDEGQNSGVDGSQLTETGIGLLSAAADGSGTAEDVPAWGSGAKLEVRKVGWSGVILEWPTATVETGYSIAGYRIYRDGSLAVDTGTNYILDGNIIRYQIGNLAPNTGYIFAVQAYSDTGKGSDLLTMNDRHTGTGSYN